jgi:molybdopterin converting factor small subunit
MPRVRLPSLLHPITGGASNVDAKGATVREILLDVDRRYPGFAERVLEGDALRGDIMLAIGGDEVRDLDAAVPEHAEVHILPAIAGG